MALLVKYLVELPFEVYDRAPHLSEVDRTHLLGSSDCYAGLDDDGIDDVAKCSLGYYTDRLAAFQGLLSSLLRYKTRFVSP